MLFSRKTFYKILLLISGLIFYFLNLSHYVMGGDSAEFSRVLTNWEIAHPPGYPIYTLLNNLISSTFPEEFKQIVISFISAIFTIITTILIFEILYKFSEKKFLAFLTSFFYSIIFLIWFYSLVPEVFSFALCLIAVQFYCLFNLIDKKNKDVFFLKIFFLISLGLSIAHHHIFVFFIPGYYYLIKNNKELSNIFLKKIFFNIFVISLTAFIAYVYIPAVSHIKDIVGMTNTKTLQGMYEMITRAPYGTFKAYNGSSGNLLNMFFDQLSLLVFIHKEFKVLGILFIVAGFFYLKKTNKILFNFFGINTISLLFFFFYSNFFLTNEFGVATFERFVTFFIINMIFYFFFGLLALDEFLSGFISKYTQKKLIKQIATFSFYSLIIGFIFINLITNYQTIKEVKATSDFEKFAKDLLNTPEKNSIIMFSADNSIFLSHYVQKNKKFREDVVMFNLGYLGSKEEFILKQFKNKIYLSSDKIDKNKRIDDFLETNYKNGINIYFDRPMENGFWVPIGILWKYYPTKEIVLKEDNINYEKNLTFWKNYNIPTITNSNKDIPFLMDIKSFYSRAMWSFISYLHLNNKNNIAIKFSDLYIDHFVFDNNYKIFYIDLKTTLKSCNQKLDEIVNKTLSMKEFQLKEFKDYLIISNYYKNCKNDKSNSQKFYNDYLRLKKYDEVPLNEM